jgi:stage II sporulation protein AA (anti-sigma F factor antagonist)
MIIQTVRESAAMVVSLSGRLDTVTAPDYEKKFDELISREEINFVVDFDKLEYISSAGLRVILATSRRIKGKNGKIHLANIGGNVKEVFEMSGFAGIFPVYGTVAEALKMITG